MSRPRANTGRKHDLLETPASCNQQQHRMRCALAHPRKRSDGLENSHPTLPKRSAGHSWGSRRNWEEPPKIVRCVEHSSRDYEHNTWNEDF